MGYELRRQLREVLGPDITGLQRAVALEIADDANEATRRSLAPLEDLVRWTGAKDGSVVRNALKRLAASGWEFRVPIGKGKDGRVLYAVPGRRMTFVVPPFEGVATATPYEGEGERGLTQGGVTAPSEGATATPSNPQGGAVAHSEGATAHSEGAVATPSSSDSSDPSSKPAGQLARPEPSTLTIPDAARPLIDALSSNGVTVRWPFRGNQWFPLLALIADRGVPAMADYAIKAARRTDIESARYFMRGWAELPSKPAPGTQPAGNVVPLASRRPSTTDQRVQAALDLAAEFRALEGTDQ